MLNRKSVQVLIAFFVVAYWPVAIFYALRTGDYLQHIGLAILCNIVGLINLTSTAVKVTAKKETKE